MTEIRRRKVGKAYDPNKGNWNEWLAGFDIHERRYVETTVKDHNAISRKMTIPIKRRPIALQNMKFTTQVFTAVACGIVGDTRILVCVERLE